MLATKHPLIDSPVWIIIYLIAAIAVVRFGLVVLAVAVFTAKILLNVPYTLDFGEWYTPASVCDGFEYRRACGLGFFYGTGRAKTVPRKSCLIDVGKCAPD